MLINVITVEMVSFQIHVLETLCGIIMPTLLPSCAKYYEVGSFLLDGDVQKLLMAVSPDGVIR